MSSLATKEVLEKELSRFTERVMFLDKWIESILEKETNDFEDLNTVYQKEQERDFKIAIIEQRKKQIDQINQEEELKKKVVLEFPQLLIDAGLSVDNMFDDLEAIKKNRPVTNKAKAEKASILSGFTQQYEQISTVYDGINERYLANNDHKELFVDFKMLNDIVKISNK